MSEYSETNDESTTTSGDFPGITCCPRQPSDVWPMVIVLVVLFGLKCIFFKNKRNRGSNMKSMQKWGVVAALVVAVAVVFAIKQKEKAPVPEPVMVSELSEPATNLAPTAPAAKSLPQLIDLGAKKCIPCKMMAPILEDLEKNYATQFTTTFYDVWENQEPAQRFKIRSIPTQIFLSPDGKELFRHEGFMSKEDILEKWKELGFPANGESNE